MKNIFHSFIFIIVVISLCLMAGALSPSVYLSEDVTANPGDTVTVEVKVSVPGDCKIQGAQIDFDYSENLTYVKSDVSKNTTAWGNVGCSDKNLLGVGFPVKNDSELVGEISFTLPKDAKAGDKYVFKIKDAVAATAEEMLDCSVFKNSVTITVGKKTSAITKPESSTPTPTPKPAEEINFTDVLKSDWFFESVKFVKLNGLMSGVSDSEFSPMSFVTRAMLVTILHRMEGTPKSAESAFLDVADGLWYSEGVSWAAEKGIVKGMGDGIFAPNNSITREQIALILYNYVKTEKISLLGQSNLETFSDRTSVSAWALEAMQWAVGTGLIGGKGDGILDPLGNATRAEIATVLKRFVEATK